jgi:hypothetical protein
MTAQLAPRSRTAGDRENEGASKASAAADALWLATLQRLCGRAAHDVKGALNGVSLNVEVVRSRSEKPGATVAPYANAAADQLEGVITMTEALLSLVRSASSGIDVGAVVANVDALIGASVRADGRRFEVDGSVAAIGSTAADGNAVRLAVAGCVMAALDASGDVWCASASSGEGDASLRIECRDGAALATDPELADAVERAGIQIRAEQSAIFIRFPG